MERISVTQSSISWEIEDCDRVILTGFGQWMMQTLFLKRARRKRLLFTAQNCTDWGGELRML
jgi:hypothetical protein